MANAIMLTKACISLTFFYNHDLPGRDISLYERGTRSSDQYNKYKQLFVFCGDGILVAVVCLGLGLQSGRLIVGLVIIAIFILSSMVTEFVTSTTVSQIFIVI